MSRRVNFYDLMLAEAADFNNVGIYAQADLDNLTGDAVTTNRRYAGFSTAILSGNTSIQIQPGRLYDNGRMFREDAANTIQFGTQLPIAAKRIALVIAEGQQADTLEQQRSVAVNADDEVGEPQALRMLNLRKANLSLVFGAESADPQAPSYPPTALVIATLLVGTAGAESVTMHPTNALPSLQKHAEALGDLSAFRARIEPTVSGLVSDLAALTERTADRASQADLARAMADVARLKDLQDLPDDYAQYGADFFANDDETDTVYTTAAQAKIDNGLLFPDAASGDWPIALFNPNDPKAKQHTSGLVLPAYNNVPLITGPETNGSEISLTQYEVKTHTIKTHTVYRTQTRYGWTWNWSNRWFRYRKPDAKYWREQVAVVPLTFWGWMLLYPMKFYWSFEEEIPEEVTSVEATSTTVNGVLTSETFRAPRAAWWTGCNLKFTSIANTGDVYVYLTETDLGQPRTGKVLASVLIAVADLKKAPVKTPAMMNPVLLESGRMYAVVIVTQGNHKVAGVDPNLWKEGTYFAGSDGDYFVGDLTKDIYIEPLCAEFTSPRNEISLQTVDLVGGIHDIKISTEQIVPNGTELSYEINLSGVWKPLATLNAMPPGTNTAPLRAVAIGSKDLMPAFYTGANRIKVSRPTLAMSHQSDTITLAAPAENFRIEYVINKWDAADHTLAPTIREGVNVRTPDVTIPPTPNDPDGETVKLAYVFNLPAPISSFKIRTDATRDTAAAPPTILERTHIALS